MATQHLIDLGHRRIAFLGGLEGTDSRAAHVGGFAATILEVDTGPPVSWPCPSTKADALAATEALLERYPGTTGLVCYNDVVAMGASLAFTRLGLKAAKDVSIVGFDDIEDAALWTPALTTVAVDPKTIGLQLARSLLERNGISS